MRNICERFKSQIKENKNKICFKYDGKLINEELKFEEEVNGKDKELNIMNIMVEEENKRELNENKNGLKDKLDKERKVIKDEKKINIINNNYIYYINLINLLIDTNKI